MKKVFVASSGDLFNERRDLKLLLYDMGVKPILWESSDQSITQKEFQDRLNKELGSSHIVIFMVKTRFGKYTKEEFDFAYKRLGRDISKIYVYFFEQNMYKIDKEQRDNIFSFREQIESMKSIYKDVKDFQELENEILKQKEHWGLSSYLTPQSTKNLESLKNILQKHYLNNLTPLKEAILNYIPTESISYENVDIDSFNGLFSILSKEIEGKYIYCVLKELKIDTSYIENLKSSQKCTKLSRKVDRVLFLIEPDSHKDISACNIDIWYIESLKHKLFKSLNNVNFQKKEDYESRLSDILAKIKKEKRCSQALEIQLILPNRLLESKYDFKGLQIKLNPSFRSKKWSKYFNITTKFLYRYSNYDFPQDYIEWWKEKSKSYRDRSSKEVKSVVYCCNGEIIDPFNHYIHDGKEFLFSDTALLDEESLEEILMVATPFVICPQKDRINISTINLEKSCTATIKKEAFLLFNKTDKTIHYIHDDAYDTKQLKLAVESRAKIENEKDDNDFLI